MEKLDMKKAHKEFYAPGDKEPVYVSVPSLKFLMVDGQGDPGTSQMYTEAIQALYGLAYKMKFAEKKQTGRDYVVMPLEGLWWADNMDAFMEARRDEWKWTAMIAQPDFITEDMMSTGKEAAAKNKDQPILGAVHLEVFTEGPAAQIMHIGPYAGEAPTIEKLHTWIDDNGWLKSGKHHEIYISDPNRTAPEKMKTVIRQPVKKVS